MPGRVSRARAAKLGLDWMENIGHSLPGAGGARFFPGGGYAYRTKAALEIDKWHDYSMGGAIACRPTKVTTGDGGYAWVLRQMVRPGSAAFAPGAPGGPYGPQSQFVNLHLGLNDMGVLGAANPLPFQEALRTILGRICAGAVFEDTDASWTYAGTWAAPLSIQEFSASNSGSTITFTTLAGGVATWHCPADFPAGRVIGIGLWMNATNGPCVYGVTIDGVAYPDITVTGTAVTDQSTANNHISLLRRFGTGGPGDPQLAAGAHTIQITLKSGPSLAIDYAHIEADPLDGPIIGCPLPNKPANYSIWAGNPGGASMNDAAVDAWKGYTRTVLTEFAARVIRDQHGLGIDLDDANLNKAIDGTGDYIGDGAHPNERGHGKWTDLYAKVVRSSPLITDRIRSRPIVDPRPRAWKKTGQINGAGTFGTGWNNFSTNGLYDMQFRRDDRGHIYVKGAVKAAAGATSQVLANGSLPFPANLVSKVGNHLNGTAGTWVQYAVRLANNGGLSVLPGAGAALDITAGNLTEIDFDYQENS